MLRNVVINIRRCSETLLRLIVKGRLQSIFRKPSWFMVDCRKIFHKTGQFLKIRNIAACFMYKTYYSSFPPQVLWRFVPSWQEDLSSNKSKLPVLQKSNLHSLSCHIFRFLVLIIVFTLVKSSSKSIPSKFYKIHPDREVATSMEAFPKMVQLHGLLSAHSLCLVEFQTLYSKPFSYT